MNERHRILYSLVKQFMARWIQMCPAKWTVQAFILFPADVFHPILLARSTAPHLFAKKGSFFGLRTKPDIQHEQKKVQFGRRLVSYSRTSAPSCALALPHSKLALVFHFIVLLPLALFGTSGHRVLIFFFFLRVYVLFCWMVHADLCKLLVVALLGLSTAHTDRHTTWISCKRQTQDAIVSVSNSHIWVSCGSMYVPVR